MPTHTLVNGWKALNQGCQTYTPWAGTTPLQGWQLAPHQLAPPTFSRAAAMLQFAFGQLNPAPFTSLVISPPPTSLERKGRERERAH